MQEAGKDGHTRSSWDIRSFLGNPAPGPGNHPKITGVKLLYLGPCASLIRYALKVRYLIVGIVDKREYESNHMDLLEGVVRTLYGGVAIMVTVSEIDEGMGNLMQYQA